MGLGALNMVVAPGSPTGSQSFHLIVLLGQDNFGMSFGHKNIPEVHGFADAWIVQESIGSIIDDLFGCIIGCLEIGGR